MSIKRKKYPKLKKESPLYDNEFGSDENFAFIAGYTSGGAPFGITHEEMAEIQKRDQENDRISSEENLDSDETSLDQ